MWHRYPSNSPRIQSRHLAFLKPDYLTLVIDIASKLNGRAPGPTHSQPQRPHLLTKYIFEKFEYVWGRELELRTFIYLGL